MIHTMIFVRSAISCDVFKGQPFNNKGATNFCQQYISAAGSPLVDTTPTYGVADVDRSFYNQSIIGS